MSTFNLSNVGTPPTPPVGTTEIFVDTDKKLKQKDDTGAVIDLTLSGSGEANTASNVGASGEGIFKQKTGVDLEFKKLIAGANVTLTPSPDGITIASTDTNTGITQLTGDVVAGPGSGSQAATIPAGVVSNSKLADMVTARFKARATAGTGAPEDITGTQATALLDAFTSVLKGLVPASGGGTTNFLRADGTFAAPTIAFDPKTSATAYDDFLNDAIDDRLGALGWSIDNTGTGTSPAMIPGESGRPGIVRLGSGATGTTRSCINLSSAGALPMNTFADLMFVASVRISSLTAFSRCVAGLGDVVTAFGDQTNGIYFTFDPAAGETTWKLVASSGGVQTRRDTGITVAANTFYRLKFTVNAAGTSIQARVDGTDVGAAITTNIPTVNLAWLFKTDGASGGTSRNFDIDYFQFTQNSLNR